MCNKLYLRIWITTCPGNKSDICPYNAKFSPQRHLCDNIKLKTKLNTNHSKNGSCKLCL